MKNPLLSDDPLIFCRVLHVDYLNLKFQSDRRQNVGTRAFGRGPILSRERVFWPFHQVKTYIMAFKGEISLIKVVGHVTHDILAKFGKNLVVNVVRVAKKMTKF